MALIVKSTHAPHFTTDWFSQHIKHWLRHLSSLRDKPIDYLEIGSWEGRSTLFVCQTFPTAKLTCIDPWLDEFMTQVAPRTDASDAEHRFDANVAEHAHRIRKIKSRSARALDQLRVEGAKFDVIYVDGDHTRWAAMIDATLAWPLLRDGGTLIFDDYRWEPSLPQDQRPQQAVELFCKAFGACMEVQHVGYQVIVRKTADWPARSIPLWKLPEPLRRVRRLMRRALS